MKTQRIERATDPRKVAFITCVNDDDWYSECRLYLEHLVVPDGMSVEFHPIRSAASMCAGYNQGMMASDAKYKVYLHQDTLVVNKFLIRDLLELFSNPTIGLVGGLTEKAADDLGLCEGTPVFGGGGDASLIGVGAGAVALGDTHIYCGTSGWVTTVVDKNIVDTRAMIAAIVGAQNGKLNYFAELETAGKCLEWVKDHLALDEIDIFLEKTDVASSKESIFTSLYDYMSHVINKAPAGCGGVIFTPWLHGNRCPFEDPNARGMFFNISLETGKTELIRAVVEGTCMHLRWFLETEDKKTKTSDVLRFVGGGALSDVTSQILADCTGRTVEVVASPQNVGAVGAAVISAVGLGMIGSIEEAKKLVPAKKTFIPNPSLKPIYDKNFAVFKNLYKSNKENFAALNG